MKIVIVSDIHGNYDALSALAGVLRRIVGPGRFGELWAGAEGGRGLCEG